MSGKEGGEDNAGTANTASDGITTFTTVKAEDASTEITALTANDSGSTWPAFPHLQTRNRDYFLDCTMGDLANAAAQRICQGKPWNYQCKRNGGLDQKKGSPEQLWCERNCECIKQKPISGCIIAVLANAVGCGVKEPIKDEVDGNETMGDASLVAASTIVESTAAALELTKRHNYAMDRRTASLIRITPSYSLLVQVPHTIMAATF